MVFFISNWMKQKCINTGVFSFANWSKRFIDMTEHYVRMCLPCNKNLSGKECMFFTLKPPFQDPYEEIPRDRHPRSLVLERFKFNPVRRNGDSRKWLEKVRRWTSYYGDFSIRWHFGGWTCAGFTAGLCRNDLFERHDDRWMSHCSVKSVASYQYEVIIGFWLDKMLEEPLERTIVDVSPGHIHNRIYNKKRRPSFVSNWLRGHQGLNEFVLKELTKLATSSLPCEFLLKRMRRMLPGCPRWVA